MKKILILLSLSVILLTGCQKGDEVVCTIEGKDVKVVLKDGIVKDYIIDGTKKSSSEIAEINGEYFTSSVNNEEGKEALKKYIQSINGSCE